MIRTPRIQLKEVRKRIDLTILILVLVLTSFGLIIVYDASAVQAFQDFSDKYYYIKQQLIWAAVGFLSLCFFTFFDHQLLKKIALPIFVVSMGLLVMVNFSGLGVSAGGAHRWLRILNLTIQPAEIIKLSSIIFFASIFEKRLSFLAFIIILGFVFLMVGVLQKDLGTTIVFSIIAVGMYYLAGAPLKIFTLILPGLLLGMGGFILSSSYRKARILAFLDPFADTKGITYHISQVLIALGSGGLFGLGLGQSRQKFSFIPEVTTDSIFAIIGEELGFVGALCIILMLTFLIIRMFKVAQNSQNRFSKIVASGITLWVGAQVVINLAAMVSLIPLTGVPLPFISYGGSALLTNLVAVGILLNISKSSS